MRRAWFALAVLTAAAGCTNGRIPVAGRIVFTTDRDGRPQIYAMNADGSEQTNLSARDGAPPGAEDAVPACAAGGSTVAFTRLQEGKDPIIWLMAPDGSNQREVPGSESGILAINPRGFQPWHEPQFYDVALSPDGSKMVYAPGPFAQSSLDTSGGTPELLANGYSAAWSVDGKRLVLRGEPGTDLYVMNADGSDVVQLTDDVPEDRAPVWSPDGTRIAFESAGRDGKFDGDIFVIDADGRNLTRLTTDPGRDVWPAWSPDGTKIAFQSDRGGAEDDVYIMNVDGTGQTALTRNDAKDGHPCWLPGP
jgi:Tol biopolymer transport system component